MDGASSIWRQAQWWTQYVRVHLAGVHYYGWLVYHKSMTSSTHPLVWRGESSGVLFDEFDLSKTRCGVGFFFAHRHDHAAFYAGAGTEPRSFRLDPGTCLDLDDAYGTVTGNAKARQVIEALREEFDEWVDRRSGEAMDVVDFLEAGNLYDYEGTGSATRWNMLFTLAQDAGFDSVRVRDVTDGVSGEDAMVWVVFDPTRITACDPEPQTVRTPGNTRVRP